jgi:hypothetical protein
MFWFWNLLHLKFSLWLIEQWWFGPKIFKGLDLENWKQILDKLINVVADEGIGLSQRIF